ncbi:UNVERIFIED_CONTAM: hypothetical protein GTU68_010193 [Idotea baltica]|nr:hypothetical protein [Idotea baltica]
MMAFRSLNWSPTNSIATFRVRLSSFLCQSRQRARHFNNQFGKHSQRFLTGKHGVMLS